MSTATSTANAAAGRRLAAKCNVVSNVELVKATITPQPMWARQREHSDDISTATECSDAEDTASSMSRSSSNSDLSHVICRETMLVHRARCLPGTTGGNRTGGLFCKQVVSSPSVPTNKAVQPAPTSKTVQPAPPGFVPPPGLESLSGAAISMPSYSPQGFRKELMAILKDLALDRNVARAVRRVRAQGVPCERHAAEYADAITFVLEEHRGAARRSFVALLAGLANGVFEKEQCLAGLGIFMDSVYPDLKEEVPKLNKLVCAELLPTLGSIFSAEQLSPFAAKAKA